jgi:cytochrome P450
MTSTLHRRTARPPGPGHSAFTSIRTMRRMGPNHFFTSIRREYPRLAFVRFGAEPAYLVFTPDLARTVLVDAARDTMKGRGLQRSKELLGEGLLTSEGALHRRQRRLVQPAFHAARVERYMEVMVGEGRRLADLWNDGDTIDLGEQMSELTLRVVAKALFGTTLSTDDIALVGRALNGFLDGFQRVMLPGAAVLLRLPTPRNLALKRSRDLLDTLVYRMIAEHRAAGDTGDLLSMLLMARDAGEDGPGPDPGSGSGESMSDMQVRDETLTLLLAGHETTANALTWAWRLLADNPEAVERLHTEVDGLGRAPEPADAQGLPWCRAVIAESMRLYPPAWVSGRRTTGPVQLDEYTVPAGSLLVTSQWVMHRDERWWGEDAARFRPQRWLTEDGRFDLAAPGAPRGAYFPFGAGRRVCIGESFAWAEGVLLLAALARRWTVEPTERGKDVYPTQPSITLRPAGPVPARIRLRTRDFTTS